MPTQAPTTSGATKRSRPKSRPKGGTAKLSEVARHVILPSGIVSTGWGPVRRTCREKLGITFDEWQEGAGRVILAKREDGNLAAMVGGIGMSLPRQVGKTYLLAGLIFGLCINEPGLLVIWSAHHARTHGETFLSMQAFADRSKVKPYIDQVYTGSGDEEIRFANGSRILFGARERGFGRGIPGVDVLVMDEAQILSDKALENMLATLNTSSFGLQLYIGTPPRPEDNAEAFRRMRTEALTGESDDAAWIECGADPDADPDDRKQWAKANPSHPHRTPVESIQRLRKKLTVDGFRHEGLGIWDDDGGRKPSIFGRGRWESCGDAAAEMPPTPAAIGVAVSVDQMWASIAAATVLDAEDSADPEAEPVERPFVAPVDRREDTDWVVAEVKRIQDEHDCAVVIDEKGPAAHLIPLLEDAGVAVDTASLAEYVQACSDVFRKVRAGELVHPSDPELDDAVDGAEWRSVGDGQRVWGRKKSTSDVSMLEAATLAIHGAERFRRSAYEQRGLVRL